MLHEGRRRSAAAAVATLRLNKIDARQSTFPHTTKPSGQPVRMIPMWNREGGDLGGVVGVGQPHHKACATR